MLHEHDDVNLAIKEFEKKFKDKTNNKGKTRQGGAAAAAEKPDHP